MTHTPRFDAALDAILVGLQPHERTCRVTGERFTVSGEDIEMYRLLRVPPPTTSPWYRSLRRQTFLPHRFQRSRCAVTHREFVGEYRSDAPFVVYHPDVWSSDQWDAFAFGRSVQFDVPFFPQWYALFRAVPHPGSSRDPQSVNSEFTMAGKGMKDCYYTRGSVDVESVSYSMTVTGSRESMDCMYSERCERCYDVLSSQDCYRVQFAEHCRNCRDSAFLYDSRNCSDCFGGWNLRNARFVFMGEQLDEGTYRERRNAIRLGYRPTFERITRWYTSQLQKHALHPAVRQENCEDCTGSDIKNCAHGAMLFTAIDCAHCRYIFGAAFEVRDCADAIGGFGLERCYELAGGLASSGATFSYYGMHNRNVEYCARCYNCSDCFGCVGLRNARHCILNRQYTEEEYWNTVDRLKTAMLGRGEYGEFFPAKYAPYPYEDSRATMVHPIASGDRMKLELWTIGDDPIPTGDAITSPPEDIHAITESVCTATFQCRITQRRFRVTPQELAFYQREDLPIPDCHPDTRNDLRFQRLPEPMRLWERACAQCGTKDLSDIPPNDPRKHVLCLTCYRVAVG